MRTFAEIFDSAPRGLTIAVAGADDGVVLKAVSEAYARGIVAGGVLAAADPACAERARDAGLPVRNDKQEEGAEKGAHEGFTVVLGRNDAEACAAAVAAIRAGGCDILMKGFVQTRDFMRAVLHKETGLTAGGVLSQTGVYEVPGVDRLLFIADVGIVISPTLEQKVKIIEGALGVAHSLGNAYPRVALLSCVETVNPAIPGNSDAAMITMMHVRGQIVSSAGGEYSKAFAIDGPLALDNAISMAAALHKGITSEVAGRADILITPDLNSGNMLAKSVIYLAGAEAAGVVTGAKCPIVLTSRADTDATKLHSIAVAALLSATRVKKDL